jgi:hypothetical protein
LGGVIKEITINWACSTVGRENKLVANPVLTGRPLRKLPLEDERGWEDNIKLDVEEIVCKVEANSYWLRLVSYGVLWYQRCRTFGFYYQRLVSQSVSQSVNQSLLIFSLDYGAFYFEMYNLSRIRSAINNVSGKS